MRGPLGQSLGRFALLAAGIALLGLAGGWLYAKGQPRAAAGALISDFVEVVEFEGNDQAPADPDRVAPASGDHLGTVVCEVAVEDLAADDHLATIAAGNVVVFVRPDITTGDLGRLISFASQRDGMLVTEEPRLEVPVLAVAWNHRMPLPDVNLELLAAFQTARAGLAPDAMENPCLP